MGGLPVKVQERWGVTSKGARDMGGYQSRQGVQERGSSSRGGESAGEVGGGTSKGAGDVGGYQ